MKNRTFCKILPFLTALLGLLGCGLRWLLYRQMVDSKNLIPVGHPYEWILWAVTALTAILVIACIRPLRRSEEIKPFRPAPVAAAGCVIGAVGILAAVLGDGLQTSGVPLVRDVLGIVAAGALVAVAVYRWQGREPLFLLHTAVCVFFAVHMVNCYERWSCNSQLMDYIFTLLANVGLVLFPFYHACLEAQLPKPRLLPIAGLLTAYCCIVALSGTDFSLLYLCGGIWALTNLLGLHRGE